MTLNSILVTIALITFIVYAVINILHLLDLRKTSAAFRQFLAKTDAGLSPVLTELRASAADIRKLSAETSAVIEKVRAAAAAIASVEKTIEHLYGYYRDGFSQSALGLKAGLRAGVITLVNNLKRKRDGQP